LTEDLILLAEASSARGWQWVVHNLNRFLPVDSSNPQNMKQIDELALLYAHSLQWLNDQNQKEIRKVGEFLTDFLQLPEIAHLARKRPGYYVAYMYPYLNLRMSGQRIASYEDALAAIKHSGYPSACEKVPYRAIELKYVMWKAGLTRRSVSWKTNYQTTVLGRSRNPAYIVDWEVYSITHTLFYLTGFSGSGQEIPPRDRKRVVDLVEVLLVNYWRKRNWDLVGELLLNLVGMDRSGTPLFRLCADAFFKAWRSDGMVPGPTFALDGEQSSDYIFEHCYHTTLVGLLLCEGYLYRSIDSRRFSAE
jgi:hypothetical protein